MRFSDHPEGETNLSLSILRNEVPEDIIVPEIEPERELVFIHECKDFMIDYPNIDAEAIRIARALIIQEAAILYDELMNKPKDETNLAVLDKGADIIRNSVNFLKAVVR
jgi:hypothetical protein